MDFSNACKTNSLHVKGANYPLHPFSHMTSSRSGERLPFSRIGR